MRKDDRYYELEHERIFRETGVPNPMMRGDLIANEIAYPNGLLSERIARWLVGRMRRALRRSA
jgi:hypothetical protein